MAGKKRSQKAQKQLRQEVAQRARRGRRAERAAPQLKFDVDFSQVDPGLLADVRGAFPSGGVVSPAAMSELAVDSQRLIDEPEFEEIAGNPLLAAYRFINLVRDKGLKIDVGNAEELAPIVFDLMPYLLREDQALHSGLVAALATLRERMKKRGHRLNAGRAAMAQLLLEHGDPSSWKMIGVVQRAVTRSIFAGFRMSGAGEASAEEE